MIEEIIKIEWTMFQAVNHINGRAVCQDDYETFVIMRKAHFSVYNEDSLASYLEDLTLAQDKKRNLIYEKYAWMMERTDPIFFDGIKSSLPFPSYPQMELIREIVLIQIPMKLRFNKKYPQLAEASRPIYTTQDEVDDVSFETYLTSELRTYSYKSVELLCQHFQEMDLHERNIVEETLLKTVQSYGYSSLEEANRLNDSTLSMKID